MITILVGVSGSGKSVYAEKMQADSPDLIRIVSRDVLREKYFGTKGKKVVLSFQDESMITLIEQRYVYKFVQSGKHVIIDDTNLRTKYIDQWISFAKKLEVPVEIKIFECELNEAIRRDTNRCNSVGEEVVRRQYQLFRSNLGLFKQRQFDANAYANIHAIEIPKTVPFIVEPYVKNCDLPKAVWVDVDGTLAKAKARDIYDYSRVHTDELIDDVAIVVRALKQSGVRIIIMSGRSDDCQDVTEEWLKSKDVPYDEIHMRKTGDKRSDEIVKYELFNEFIRDRYCCIGAFDDRLRVSRLIIELGLKLFFVGDPDYEF